MAGCEKVHVDPSGHQVWDDIRYLVVHNISEQSLKFLKYHKRWPLSRKVLVPVEPMQQPVLICYSQNRLATNRSECPRNLTFAQRFGEEISGEPL